LRAADRLTVTLDPGSDEPADLASSVPGDVDVVLFETHDPIGHPTILSTALAPARDEQVIGRWVLYGEDAAVAAALPLITAALPADHGFDYALRAAMRLHGGHACAGLVLGARLALAGTRALEVPVPDQQKRLLVTCETDRCAVDAIQAVTGCRAGKRTLRLLDFGKLAATFHDERTGRSLRVAARGDLRERVGGAGPERHELQRRAYATWPETELFSFSEARVSVPQFDRPGPPRFRVNCAACGEEVSDHRHVETEAGPMCKSCTAGEIEPAGRAMGSIDADS
jgi:formylmethanofuran dehydrogenase subunit E